MQKFCRKCGQKLDEKTGLCPNCDKSKSKQEVHAAKKEHKKAVKKEKWQMLSPKQKIKKLCLRLLLVVLVFMLAAGSVTGILIHLKLIDIPVVSTVLDKLDSNEPVYVGQSSDSCYTPNEENIIYTDNEKSFGYVNNIVLVFFVSGAEQEKISEVIDSINGKIVGKIDGINQYQIQIEATTEDKLKKICDELLAFDIVKDAVIDRVFTTDINEIPNDPWKDIFQGSFGVDWNEDEPSGTNWWFEAVKISSAWEYSDHFKDIKVGIVDNGYDTKHEDLNITVLNNSLNSYENHGTHVAGVIGATINNKKGISGILKNVSLYGVDCYSTSKQEKMNISVSSLYDGINQCIQNNCKIINMSSGVEYTGKEKTKKVSYEMSKYATNCIVYLLDTYGKDFLIVQSAGNGDDWNKGVNAKEYNGWFSGIDTGLVQALFDEYKQRGVKTEHEITVQDVMDSFIVVAAVDEKKKKGEYQLSSFSNYGDTVTVCAPGVNIFSTIKSGGLDGSYGYLDGTSMSAPIVSGIAALVWSIDQEMHSGEVKQIITDTAKTSVLSRRKQDKGTYFMIDAAAAAEMAVKKLNAKSEQLHDQRLFDGPKSPRTTSDERDIVLVLDVSGSMAGKPIEETKKAASNFINTILKEDASIGIVTYDDSASMLSDFSVDGESLKAIASNITDGGSTNIEAGLSKAEEMLSTSNAKKKIIVLMSDGEPNDGKVGEELISYADSIKDKGTYIYTLGFFESIGSSKSSAQTFMERIASDGCHYEVANADDLRFFFGDIADQINGQKYIYVRIACPVDVNVTHKGETLTSAGNDARTRTSFGSLTFEENPNKSEDSTDDRIKILRLKDRSDYDIQIEGNGKGKMNYTIGFMDENGEYSDLREFRNIKISKKTQIDTFAGNSTSTLLKVDSDGDGRYDLKYKAKANGIGEIVDYTYILYIICGVLILAAMLIVCMIIKKRKKQLPAAVQPTKYCIYCGNKLSGDKNFCTRCGKKLK